jgi:hexosaminidase
METPERVEYMTFPRILALAEVVWTPPERRSWDDFETRLGEHYARLAAHGVRFRVPPPVGLHGTHLITEGATLTLTSPVPGGVIRWVRGRRVPNQDARRYEGPLAPEEETAITARVFLPDGRASRPVTGAFERAVWLVPVDPGETAPGLDLAYHEGRWQRCAELRRDNPVRRGVQAGIGLPAGHRPEHFGCVLAGFIRIPADGVYTFGLTSDDGSRLFVGDRLLIRNDGLHGSRERIAQAALRAGHHAIRVEYFQAGGAAKLLLTIAGGGHETQPVPAEMLVR